MQTQTEPRTPITHDAALSMPKGSRGRRGRKDSTGDEQVLKAQPIKEALTELMASFKRAEAARIEFNDLRKKVAERSNASASDLSKLLKASAKGNFEDVQRKIQGTADLFELIGEVSGGAVTAEVAKQ